jgi:hypothetical protein
MTTHKTEGRYRVEVIADDSGQFVANALRFDTAAEARAYAEALADRWTLVRSWRVVDGQTEATAVENRNPVPPYPKFPLGRVVATPGALEALERNEVGPTPYIRRHVVLDPGDLSPEDIATNARALAEGERIFSAYHLDDGTRIWVITERDRSVTTLLLPEEY